MAAHAVFEVEVVVPDNVEVIKIIGGGGPAKYGSAKILIRAHSDVDVSTAKASGDDLGDAIKTAFA